MSKTETFKRQNGERPENGNNEDTEEVEGYGVGRRIEGGINGKLFFQPFSH